jgi:plasmid segregation protein ParM
MKISVGMDIGHSAPKLVWATSTNPAKHYQDLFLTVVCPAIPLSDEGTRRRAARETVNLNGRDYFYGETAVKQGRAQSYSGQDKDWIFTDTHDVLVIGAFRRVAEAVETTIGYVPNHYELIVGLPQAWYDTQRRELKSRVTQLVEPMLRSGQTVNVRAQSQPNGPLQEMIFLPDGRVNPAHDFDNERWGVIEVGQGTSDFILTDGPDFIEAASGSCVGFAAVYERMTAILQSKNLPSDLGSVDRAIRNGALTAYGKQIDLTSELRESSEQLLYVVRDEAQRRFGEATSSLNGVIVAGGGAQLLFPGLREVFPHAVMSPAPRFSVSEGFCRYGLSRFNP